MPVVLDLRSTVAVSQLESVFVKGVTIRRPGVVKL